MTALRDERASLFARQHAFRLSESARSALIRAPVMDDAGEPAVTRIAGPDPVRVLLFGSGPLTGYGVRRRAEAVDGHLAALLASRLGRGAVIESRVRLGLVIDQAIDSLRDATPSAFDAAVWAPRFGEEFAHGRTRTSRLAVRVMLHEFRERTAAPLVVCLLPTPLGVDWRTVFRRPRVALLNRLFEEEAAAVPDVTTAPSGNYHPALSTTTLGPEWHLGLAEHLLPAVLDAVGRPAPARTAPGRRPTPAGSPVGEAGMLEIGDIFERAAEDMEQQGRGDRAAQYLLMAWEARDAWRRHAGLVPDPADAVPVRDGE